MSSIPFVGAHVSAAGGIHKAPGRAAEIGCNAVQIFSDSPRVWQRRTTSEGVVNFYNQACKDHGILSSVIHSLYLVNLASENPEQVEKSINSIAIDMDLSVRIHAVGVVVHVGSHKGAGWESCSETVVRNIAKILDKTHSDSVFLIENAAGQNGKVGSDLREIRFMLDRLQAGKRVGVCIDSCHAFASGYSLIPMEGEKLLYDWIDELHLQSDIKVLHVNDSKDPYLSRRDRHENLGGGTIGNESLKAFVNHQIFAGLPMILEVPGVDNQGPDIENVSRLKKLFV